MIILIIDDDKKITSMLERNLLLEGYNINIANDGETGLNLSLKKDYDLIILDIMLPSVDGYKLCELLRKEKDTPILMLTAKDEIKDRVKGLNLGADDYLVKPFAIEELLARIKALLRRLNKDKKLITYANLKLDYLTREVWINNRQINLTAKEFDLLYLFMKNPRQVLTRDQLMTKIWGIDYIGESNVLEVFIGYLRQKLEANGEERLIHTVRGVGYTLRK